MRQVMTCIYTKFEVHILKTDGEEAFFKKGVFELADRIVMHFG